MFMDIRDGNKSQSGWCANILGKLRVKDIKKQSTIHAKDGKLEQQMCTRTHSKHFANCVRESYYEISEKVEEQNMDETWY